MREVRVALLEADVNLEVANDFVKHVTEKALGTEVIKEPAARAVDGEALL